MIEVQTFRAEVRQWLADNLVGEFAALKGLGGPGREHEAYEERRAWNQHLAAAGLTCLGWPEEHGGRGLSVAHRVAFYEEYAKADAPDKVELCAMAKRYVTDSCYEVADAALQLHGGYGYLREYGLEKIVRDLRVHRILEGTNEIMRVVIGRAEAARARAAG